jgi:sugar phosphate isomerase/epimerase
MLRIRIGVQLASLRLPFAQAAKVARQLNAEAVEIDARGELNPSALSGTGRRQIRKLLDDLQLKVAAVSFRTRRGYNVKEDLEQRVEATRDAMRLAFDLGASLVVNQIGRVPDKPEGESWRLLIEVLSDLGREGQRVGALLAAETGSEEGTALAELVRALPAGALAIDLNPGNLIVNGFSAAAAVRALAPHVFHVHATDAVRDLARGRGVNVPLGTGAADYPDLLSVLEEQRYPGYLTLERPAAANPQLELAQDMEFLRGL